MKRVIVIGAGVIGCTTALALRENHPDWQVTVLERGKNEFCETSRYNSGVIHSGINQKSSSLKSRLAREGAPMLLDFCRQENVPFRKAGMVIVAVSRDLLQLFSELHSLFLLYSNSRKQGIPLRVVTGGWIRKREPAVRALLGIYMPNIWIVDQLALGRALVAAGQREGASFVFGADVSNIQKENSLYVITADKTYEADILINCAGLSADLISAMANIPGYKTYTYRGEYYEVIGAKSDLLQSLLVYPALPPGHPVRGIHLTKTVDGRLLIGPNASKWASRTDDFTVHSPLKEFFDGVRRFLPKLQEGDLQWAYSGIRPKISPGAREDDFIIKRECTDPTLINCIGIESPGLTASFAIARYIDDLLKNESDI